MTGSDVAPEFIVIGSGPAGVSAAIPLVEAGRRVLMIDGATERDAVRYEPWRRMLGDRLEALLPDDGLSPKWRTPEARQVIGAFQRRANFEEVDFLVSGALARGGLSRIWGNFVAELDDGDLAGWPVTAEDLQPSYRTVTDRIGVSGSSDDDMAAFYGRSGELLAPPALSPIAAGMLERYASARPDPAFALGRARNALITSDRGSRQACDLSFGCLWGCARGAIYDARQDLALLRERANFQLLDQATATRLARVEGAWEVATTEGPRLRAPRLVVAAGTLGSLRLVASLIDLAGAQLRLLNSPVMAVPLVVAHRLRHEAHGHALAQLGFRLTYSAAPHDYVSGGVYEVTALPTSFFAAQLPLGRRAATAIFRALAPALAIAVVYFPGHCSANEVTVRPSADGPHIRIRGGVTQSFAGTARQVRVRLARIWRKLGAFALPGATVATPGTDAHLGGLFPMGGPQAHGTSRDGELNAAPGVHLVDGSVLPTVSSKFTTLTIMANADRIGRHLAGLA